MFGHGRLGDYLYYVVWISLITHVWREWDWTVSNARLVAENDRLKHDVASLSLRLRLEHLTSQKQCERYTEDGTAAAAAAAANDDAAATATTATIEASYLDPSIDAFRADLQRKTQAIRGKILHQPRVAVFNLNGLGMTIVAAAAQLVEVYALHASTVKPSAAADDAAWGMGNRYFEAHIARRKHLANGVAHAVLFAVCSLAWLAGSAAGGWSTFVPLVLKFVCVWSAANYVSYWAHNLMRLRPYLPQKLADWQASARRPMWWAWLSSRVFTSEHFMFAETGRDATLDACVSLFLSLFSDVLAVWPYRYYYYHGCGASPPTPTIPTADSTGASSCRPTDLFLLNMVLQLALSSAVCHFVKCVALGSPGTLKAWVSRITGRVAWSTDPARVTEAAVSTAMLFLGLNACVALLRVVWFFFTGCGGCTWYGSLLLLLFPYQHLNLFLSYMSTAAAALERTEVRQRDRDAFLQQFLVGHVGVYRDHYLAKGLPPHLVGGQGAGGDAAPAAAAAAAALVDEPLLAEAAALGSAMFEALLDRTSRHYITGYGAHTYKASMNAASDKGKDKDKGKDGGDADQESYYSRAFHHVCVEVFAAARAAEAEAEEEAGEEAACAAGDDGDVADAPSPDPTWGDWKATGQGHGDGNGNGNGNVSSPPTSSSSSSYSSSYSSSFSSSSSSSSSSSNGKNSKVLGTPAGQDDNDASAVDQRPPPVASAKNGVASAKNGVASAKNGRPLPPKAFGGGASGLSPVEETRLMVEAAMGAVL